MEKGGFLPSPFLAIAVAMLLSVVAATVGRAWWTRRPGSSDLVFADLMIWGLVRRCRTEKRLAHAAGLLGPDEDLSPGRRAEILEQLSAALEARDAYTHGHTKRVTRHAHMIAVRLGLPPTEVANVRTAAAVHDVGKIAVPREILNKAGKLTDEELAVIQSHPVDGAEMVAAMNDADITAMVRHHHERLDGSGYPDRLAGDEIPLGARIIAVADTFDAITSSRPYRPACQHRKAIEILRKEAGSQLDHDAVLAFLGYYSGRRSVGWWALATAAPQRLAGWLSGLLQGGGVAPITQVAATVGAAALLSGSVAVPGQHTQARAASLAGGNSAAASYQGISRPPLAFGAKSAFNRDSRRGNRKPGRDGSGEAPRSRKEGMPPSGSHAQPSAPPRNSDSATGSEPGSDLGKRLPPDVISDPPGTKGPVSVIAPGAGLPSVTIPNVPGSTPHPIPSPAPAVGIPGVQKPSL
jgi:HD superfamily phosphodiesterase